MNDPIDRQAAIDAANDWLMDCFNVQKQNRSCGLIRRLEDLPPAQKLGKWERHWSRPGVYADLYWHCTACGGKMDMQFAHIYFKYCPYCGARMERGTDE